jgi:hypothetical protein
MSLLPEGYKENTALGKLYTSHGLSWPSKESNIEGNLRNRLSAKVLLKYLSGSLITYVFSLNIIKLINNSVVRIEVFTAVTMKNGVFWVVTPCGSCKNRRFGGTWSLLHQGDKNRRTRNVGSYKSHTA